MIYFLLNILAIAAISWFLYQWITPKLKPQIFLFALLLKLLCGCLLGLLYMYHYDGVGDSLTYHKTAQLLANTARSDWQMAAEILINNPLPEYQQQPRAWVMVRIVTIFHIITNNSYWLTSCWFSLFSFAGLYFMASVWSVVMPRCKTAMVIAMLFFPSVVFWSSGIIKESIVLGCIGFALGFLFKGIYSNRAIIYPVLSIFFIVLLWQLKYYVAAVWTLILVPFIFSLIPYFQSKKSWRVLIIFATIAVLVSISHPNFYPQRFSEVIFTNYAAYHELSTTGDAMVFPYEGSNLLFVFLNSPFALFTALFMPLVPNQLSLASVVASAENWLLLALFGGWVISIINKQVRFDKIKIMLIFYIILLAVFLALSVPNFGTLSRFRISFLPFFVWLILVDNYFLMKFKIDLEKLTIWIKSR